MAKRGRVLMERSMITDNGLAAERPRPDATVTELMMLNEAWKDVVELTAGSSLHSSQLPPAHSVLPACCGGSKRLAQIIKDYRKKKDFDHSLYAELQKAALSQTLIMESPSCSTTLGQQSNFNQKRRLPGTIINYEDEYQWKKNEEKW